MNIRQGAVAALVLAFGLSLNPAAQAAPKQASAAQVRQLMRAAGTAQAMHAMASQMAARLSKVFQAAYPCVPADYWNGFAGEQGQQQMLNLLVPVYQRHFNAADVASLLKFYHSPVGRKLISERPAIMRESMQIGSQWGRARMHKMIAKLKSEGTLNDKGKCPAPK